MLGTKQGSEQAQVVPNGARAHPALSLDDILDGLSGLSSEELFVLKSAIKALGSVREGQREATIVLNDGKGSGPRTLLEWKYINGYGPYPYLRWREGGKFKSKYLKGWR